jgi:hypothetical protein
MLVVRASEQGILNYIICAKLPRADRHDILLNELIETRGFLDGKVGK